MPTYWSPFTRTDGASHSFCQGEERYAFAFLTAEPFRKPAAAGIVPGEDGVGDGIDQCLQGEVTDIKRRSIQNSGDLRQDDPCQADADTQDPFPFKMIFVDKDFQLICYKGRVPFVLNVQSMRKVFVGYFLPGQIGRRKPETMAGDTDTDGTPCPRKDTELHGRPPAGGLCRSGVLNKPGVQKFRDILVNRRKAQIQIS